MGVFRFKSFEISHDKSAQKVSTDSVLLGSWFQADNTVKNILDVGAGCGLLSLMATQRFPAAHVLAIEIDGEASGECKENFNKSPWSERLEIVNSDFREWKSDIKFDVILSNPPYFKENTFSPSEKRNVARHDDTLDVEYLIGRSVSMLAENGKIALVYPISGFERILRSTAFAGLEILRLCKVSTVEGKEPRLLLVEIGKSPAQAIKENLFLRNSNGDYSQEYLSLTRDFYLFLH